MKEKISFIGKGGRRGKVSNKGLWGCGGNRRIMDEEEGENEKQEACIIILKVGEGRF